MFLTMLANSELNQLNRWCDHFAQEPVVFDTTGVHYHHEPPFRSQSFFNSKLALWCGDPLGLPIDALVHPTMERFERLTPFTDHLYNCSGPQLKKQLFNRIKRCRTGNVQVTQGYSIPAKYILHTATPRYKRKFHSASSHALFRCYFNVLSTAKQFKLRTIAIPSIAIRCHGFPEAEAANIGVRVVRRFLEAFPNSFDLIVFVVFDKRQYRIFRHHLRLYFPRDVNEEQLQCYMLPVNYGGQNGEPVVPGREIRIEKNPIEKLQRDSVDSDAESGHSSSLSTTTTTETDSAPLYDADYCRSRLLELRYQERTKWRRASGKAQEKNSDQILFEEFKRQRRFDRLARKSQLATANYDRKSLQTVLQKCIYVGGEDCYGRPILAIVGHRFFADSMCTDYTLFYVLNILERISKSPFVICYFHTLVDEYNQPDSGFFQQITDYIGHQHRANLKAFLYVHPSIWSRIQMWWLKTFSYRFLENKLTFINHMEQLEGLVSKAFIQQLPPFIASYSN